MSSHIAPRDIMLMALTSAGLISANSGGLVVVGCDTSGSTIGCPTDANCTIGSDVLNAGLGTATIPSPADNATFGADYAWVKGSYNTDGNTYGDNYYFETVRGESFASSHATACAVFFRRVNAAFPLDGAAASNSTGTCSDAIQQSCIDALTTRAANFTIANETDACGALQEAFESNLDGECAQYAMGNSWQNVTAESLTGKAPISGDQNSSSNCWPALKPKNDLTLIATFENQTTAAAEKNEYELTPILTVFYPGNDSIVSAPTAELTCLKVVGPSYKASTGLAPKAAAAGSLTTLVLGAALTTLVSSML